MNWPPPPAGNWPEAHSAIIAQIARKRIGEERWRQGEGMLGHAKTSTSDLYAFFDPANLGIALKVTGEIIDAIAVRTLDAF